PGEVSRDRVEVRVVHVAAPLPANCNAPARSLRRTRYVYLVKDVASIPAWLHAVKTRLRAHRRGEAMDGRRMIRLARGWCAAPGWIWCGKLATVGRRVPGHGQGLSRRRATG